MCCPLSYCVRFRRAAELLRSALLLIGHPVYLDDLIVWVVVVDVTGIGSFCDKFLKFFLCSSAVSANKLYNKNSRSGFVYSDIYHDELNIPNERLLL